LGKAELCLEKKMGRKLELQKQADAILRADKRGIWAEKPQKRWKKKRPKKKPEKPEQKYSPEWWKV